MKGPTIKDYIDAGFSLTFFVGQFGLYHGLLNGRQGRMLLNPVNLRGLKKYKNIYKLLNSSDKIIRINGSEGYYLLQLLGKDNDPMYNKNLYMVQTTESDDTIDGLLTKFNDSIKLDNVVLKIRPRSLF